ncbi:CLUMA_CG018333, isoform A [Clunio marinus]|uniref:CLUMA_CG018333, isoform A n=1 Tax=Clunio marinus TaxID=568069 RepID=A0A1J1J024_9DIPT|nr:CLUMA_CG018333, isoform A [Clunio marinus]
MENSLEASASKQANQAALKLMKFFLFNFPFKPQTAFCVFLKSSKTEQNQNKCNLRSHELEKQNCGQGQCRLLVFIVMQFDELIKERKVKLERRVEKDLNDIRAGISSEVKYNSESFEASAQIKS